MVRANDLLPSLAYRRQNPPRAGRFLVRRSRDALVLDPLVQKPGQPRGADGTAAPQRKKGGGDELVSNNFSGLHRTGSKANGRGTASGLAQSEISERLQPEMNKPTGAGGNLGRPPPIPSILPPLPRVGWFAGWKRFCPLFGLCCTFCSATATGSGGTPPVSVN